MYPDSPRNWDNLGYFVTVDRNYDSPDKNETLQAIVKNSGNVANNQKEHMALIAFAIKKQMDEKVLIIYPVTKYEHGGVSYSLGVKNGFDYSNNGFYIVTDKTAKVLGTPKKSFEKVIEREISAYNKYANGEIYSFVLYDENGEMEDSCGGFYDLDDIRDVLPEDWSEQDAKGNYVENLQDYFIS